MLNTGSSGRLPSVVRWLLPVAVAVAIFCFSAQNGNESASLSNGLLLRLLKLLQRLLPGWRSMEPDAFIEHMSLYIRKGAHITEHLLLYITLLPALRGSGFRRIALWALLLTFINACSDELHQLFVPGRHGCFTDVLIDCTGAALLTLLLLLMKRRSDHS